METIKIQKYAKYTTPQLRLKAGEIFRKWIRERDKEKPCISCGIWNPSDAGHFYSAGHHPELEFHEKNVHGQCRRCNYHLHGNLTEYRKGLEKRIGKDGITELEFIADIHKRVAYKHDRFRLIEIIEKYK